MIIYRASRLEALLDPLQTLLQAAPPQHLLAPHSVIAAHPGMQRWLSRELALQRGPRGIVANLRIELPSEWLDRLALELLGEEAVALRPYRRDVLRWRIHECLDALGDARVAAYLDDSGGSHAQRRFQLAERLARIYTRYLVYRPDWLRDWAAGRDVTRSGTFLAPLWKMLHRQIGLPHRGEMIARLLEGARSDLILIPCRSGRLNWPTVEAILRGRPAPFPVDEQTLEVAQRDYRKLSMETAQRTIRSSNRPQSSNALLKMKSPVTSVFARP